MEDKNYNATFLVDKSPEEVFKAVNNVYGWWSEDFKGASQNAGDEFEVRFDDIHYSRHKLTEVIPDKKVVWLVKDSRLTFIKKTDEWTGTTNVFEINEKDGKTELTFTHKGLTPGVECYDGCFSGWNYFLGSLVNLITNGQGQPHQANENCKNN